MMIMKVITNALQNPIPFFILFHMCFFALLPIHSHHDVTHGNRSANIDTLLITIARASSRSSTEM